MDVIGAEGICGHLAQFFCIRKSVEHCYYQLSMTKVSQRLCMYVQIKYTARSKLLHFQSQEGETVSVREEKILEF